MSTAPHPDANSKQAEVGKFAVQSILAICRVRQTMLLRSCDTQSVLCFCCSTEKLYEEIHPLRTLQIPYGV